LNISPHCPIRTSIGSLFVHKLICDELGLTGFYDFEITSSYPSQTNDPQPTTPLSAAKVSTEVIHRSVFAPFCIRASVIQTALWETPRKPYAAYKPVPGEVVPTSVASHGKEWWGFR
jgi:hypothetical protein